MECSYEMNMKEIVIMKKRNVILIAIGIMILGIIIIYAGSSKYRFRKTVEEKITKNVSEGRITFYFEDINRLEGDEKFEEFVIQQIEILLDDDVENTVRSKYYTYVDFIHQFEGCGFHDQVIKDYTIQKFYSFDEDTKADLWRFYDEADIPFDYYSLGLSPEEEKKMKETFLVTHPNYYDTTTTTTSSNAKKCYLCNGTGMVKYYYGASKAEAIADGYDDYTYGVCSACDGTGYR